VRTAIPHLPVSDELLDQERADFPRVEEGMQLTLRQVEEAFGQSPVPDSVPAIGLPHSSRDGRLWVARRARRTRDLGSFDVFEAGGRWPGTVVLPPGNRKVLEVGPDQHPDGGARPAGRPVRPRLRGRAPARLRPTRTKPAHPTAASAPIHRRGLAGSFPRRSGADAAAAPPGGP